MCGSRPTFESQKSKNGTFNMLFRFKVDVENQRSYFIDFQSYKIRNNSRLFPKIVRNVLKIIGFQGTYKKKLFCYLSFSFFYYN